MTQYTVIWLDHAEGELTDIWLRANDRGAITSATAEIDRTLSRDAERQGDEVHEGLRSLTVAPIKVFFLVREEDRLVEIARIIPG